MHFFGLPSSSLTTTKRRNEMDEKRWWKSKGVWAGIVGIVLGVYIEVQTGLASGCGTPEALCITLPDVPGWLLSLLSGFGLYARKTATTMLK